MKEKEDIITVDFSVIFQIIWEKKLWTLGITFISIFVGVWYAFNASEEFVSEGKLLPEISSMGGGNSLSGLASLVGIGGFETGLKNNTDAIRPDLYPDILKATPFFMNLLQKEVVERDGNKIRFEAFYHKSVESNELIDPKNLRIPKGNPDGVVIINRLTENRIKDLRERIISNIDKKTGVISISVKLPDPVVAADVAKFAIDYMTTYITKYRTEKLKKEVDFLSERATSSKSKYFASQVIKAKYTDMFQAPTIRFQSADVQRERLDNEYKISANVYNELLKKLEEAKLRLHQETPVFQIAQSPVVPNLKSEPKRVIILLISTLVGFFLGISVTLILSKFGKRKY